ncbi:hypothetical protein Taro_043623, partial [Colocasia esculenta]|nr:hypothetical protein [Colocasia esculenta]
STEATGSRGRRLGLVQAAGCEQLGTAGDGGGAEKLHIYYVELACADLVLRCVAELACSAAGWSWMEELVRGPWREQLCNGCGWRWGGWPCEAEGGQMGRTSWGVATVRSSEWCVASRARVRSSPKIPANHFEIKPGTIQMLPSFYGNPNEDPYKHIDEFLEICSTIRIQNFTEPYGEPLEHGQKYSRSF